MILLFSSNMNAFDACTLPYVSFLILSELHENALL